MTILDTIIAQKRIEVANKQTLKSINDLEQSVFFNKPTLSLKSSLQDKNKTGIIAEFKRKSPSKGVINQTASLINVTNAYTQFGAAGISVLTDEPFLGGIYLIWKKLPSIPFRS